MIENQHPLKPVCPVKKTFLFFQKLDKLFQTIFLNKRIEEGELALIFNAINEIITISLYPVTINKGTGKKNNIRRKSKLRKTKRKNKLKERLKEYFKKSLKRKKLIN